MDHKARNVILLAALLVCLVIGYAVVTVFVPEEETTSDAPTQVTVALFRVTENGLTALSYTYDSDDDGTPELWSYRYDAEIASWLWTEDEHVPLGASTFYSASETLANATGTILATDLPAERLADYGLDVPQKEITFTDAAGGTQSFCLGAYNAYNATYCATVNGDTSTVYMLDSALFAAFDVPIEQMVYVDDLPNCKAEDLRTITLQTPDHLVTLTHTTLTEDGGEVLVWFRTVDDGEPVRVAAELAEKIDTMLFGDLVYLGCYSVDVADFADYGLNGNTTTMTVVYDKAIGGKLVEKTFTLTLGHTDAYHYYYVNPADTPVIMLLGGDIWHQLITCDDAAVSGGESISTETAD